MGPPVFCAKGRGVAGNRVAQSVALVGGEQVTQALGFCVRVLLCRNSVA